VLSTRDQGVGADDEVIRIIKRFDEMVVDGVDLARLTAEAADLLQADVCALDALNDAFVGSGPHGSAVRSPDCGRALLRAASDHDAMREVARHTVDGATVVAAGLEHGQGRLGIVWTTKSEAWTATDELILERFAQAASIAIQQRQRKDARSTGDASALERLVVGGLDQAAAMDAIRAAKLNLNVKYVIIALALDPPRAASDAVAIAMVGRALDGRQATWRPVPRLTAPLIVSTSEAASARVLDSAVADAARSGWKLSIGVGEEVAPDELHRSAIGAREALVFGTSEAAGGVTMCADLGALHLLARVPRDEIHRNRDAATIITLTDTKGGVSDLALLAAYCETGSMRKTGERMSLHHSSVEYRLRRIEELLGYSLSTPMGRFRAHVGVTVVRMSRAADVL
jgi:hypothetical protein